MSRRQSPRRKNVFAARWRATALISAHCAAFAWPVRAADALAETPPASATQAQNSAAPAAKPGTGVIEGVVALPPAPRAPGSARAQASAHDQHGAAGGAAAPAPPDAPAAVVYASPRDAATRAAVDAARKDAPPPPDAQIAQKGLRFEPSLLAVLVGTGVVFPNQDDVYHNVFSYSPLKSFDLGRYDRTEKPGRVVFDKPGVVKVFCEIHDHMRCTILVLDTPYFMMTGADGRFRLDGLPPGAYTVTAWVGDRQVWERDTDVRADAPASVRLGPPAK